MKELDNHIVKQQDEAKQKQEEAFIKMRDLLCGDDADDVLLQDRVIVAQNVWVKIARIKAD